MTATQRQSKDYLRLHRSIRTDYLERRLSLDEMIILVWLLWGANPMNGTINISYAGLAEDFGIRYTKNHINKIVTALKRKKYLWFARQQGRKGSFNVELSEYPLSTGGLKDISPRFNRKSKQGIIKNNSSSAEVEDSQQKLKELKQQAMTGYSDLFPEAFGRRTNNDKKNYKKNDNYKKNNFTAFAKKNPVSTYKPTNDDEARCLAIAQALGIEDISPLIRLHKEHGAGVFEAAYGQLLNDHNDDIYQKENYFYSLINEYAAKVSPL